MEKAAELYGITADHLMLASPDTIPILTKIINQTFAEQCILTLLKSGITTPVPKLDKPPKDLNRHHQLHDGETDRKRDAAKHQEEPSRKTVKSSIWLHRNY